MQQGRDTRRCIFHGVVMISWGMVIWCWLSWIYEGPLTRMDPSPNYHLLFALHSAYNYSHQATFADPQPTLIVDFDCGTVVLLYFISYSQAMAGLVSVYWVLFVLSRKRWQAPGPAWTSISSTFLLLTLVIWIACIWLWYRSCLAPWSTYDEFNNLNAQATLWFHAWIFLIFVVVSCFLLVLGIGRVRKEAAHDETIIHL